MWFSTFSHVSKLTRTKNYTDRLEKTFWFQFCLALSKIKVVITSFSWFIITIYTHWSNEHWETDSQGGATVKRRAKYCSRTCSLGTFHSSFLVFFHESNITTHVDFWPPAETLPRSCSNKLSTVHSLHSKHHDENFRHQKRGRKKKRWGVGRDAREIPPIHFTTQATLDNSPLYFDSSVNPESPHIHETFSFSDKRK